MPILDSFKIEDDEALYITMPILREFDDPPFYFVGEVIDFVQQTLEVRARIFLSSRNFIYKFSSILGDKIHARSSCCP